MVGWDHRLHELEFEQTLGDSEGQGRLSCCSPWCCKESDTTEQLNNSKSNRGTKTHRKQGTKLMTLYLMIEILFNSCSSN